MAFPPKAKKMCSTCSGPMPCMEHGGKVEKHEGVSSQGALVRKTTERDYPGESTSAFTHRSGMNMRHAKETARERAEDERMVKPKMKGLAHGGEVEGEHEDPEMESGESDMDEEMEHMLVDELQNALESKDKQAVLDAIRALVMSCKE